MTALHSDWLGRVAERTVWRGCARAVRDNRPYQGVGFGRGAGVDEEERDR
jgi:hypothetical protein